MVQHYANILMADLDQHFAHNLFPKRLFFIQIFMGATFYHIYFLTDY